MGPIYMFLNEFKQHTGKDVSIDEIGYETVSLYKEEIDEALIPSDVLETLDEMVVASSILFTDENGDEFMRIAVQDSETQHKNTTNMCDGSLTTNHVIGKSEIHSLGRSWR